MSKLSLSLAGVNYFQGYSPFLNEWKTARGYDIDDDGTTIGEAAAWAAGTYLDSDGNIINPVPATVNSYTRIFFSAVTLPAGTAYTFDGMQFTLQWTGSCNPAMGGGGAGATIVVDQPSKSAVLTFGTDPGNTWITLNITDHDDPPVVTSLHRTQYDSNVANGEFFNPDWLAQASKFDILRVMDWHHTNDSLAVGYDTVANESYYRWGRSDAGHPKTGVPYSVITRLAAAADCNVHVCIPHQATDAHMTSMATHFRDNMPSGKYTKFEFSNELWNFGFGQTHYALSAGSTNWPGVGQRYQYWHGHRSAQLMKIIRDVYGTSRRDEWRGVLGTQTVSTSVTNHSLFGVNYTIDNEFPTLSVDDLYNELHVTGYYGDVHTGVTGGTEPTAVTKANPAVVTDAGHGFSNGDRRRFIVTTGMTQLHQQTFEVANVTTDTYELVGVDSTGYDDWIDLSRNFTFDPLIYDLMDDSIAANLADDVTYPSRHSLFNRVLSESCETGTSTWAFGTGGTFATTVGLKQLNDTYWPNQKAIADANNLEFHQYEGNLHFTSDVYLSGWGGETLFVEFLTQYGHSQELADLSIKAMQTFILNFGGIPNQFTEGGPSTRFGPWPGIRFFRNGVIPGDETNPKWLAVRRMNDGTHPYKFRLTTQ